MSELTFPIYCEINGGASIYIIHSPSELTEFQRLGSRYVEHKLVAKILPERNLLNDMIANLEERWPRITEIEFSKRLEAAKH